MPTLLPLAQPTKSSQSGNPVGGWVGREKTAYKTKGKQDVWKKQGFAKGGGTSTINTTVSCNSAWVYFSLELPELVYRLLLTYIQLIGQKPKR